MPTGPRQRRILTLAAVAVVVLLALLVASRRAPAPRAPPVAALDEQAPAADPLDEAEAPRALLGEVVSAKDGRGVPGAEVRATLEDGSTKTAVTDGDGAFALEGLRAPITHVRFKASGFRDAELTADAIPDAREAAITQALLETPGAAPPTGSALALTVVDERGRPVTSYVATLSRRARDERHGRVAPLSVDVDDPAGRVVVPLAAGAVAINVIADGFRPSERTDADIPDDKIAEVRLVLEVSSEVRGVVVDAETARPIAGAEVSVAAVRGAIPVFTNDEGRFVLRSVVAEDMSLSVRAAGYLDLDVGGIQGARSRGDTVKLALTPKRDGVSAEVVGIGVTVAPHPSGVLIRGVIEGGPAAGKLDDGDLILEVDGVPLEPKKMRERIASIRGEEGTSVELAIRKKNGSYRRVTVSRARVGVPDG